MTQLLQNAVYGTGMILAVAVLRGALKDRLLPEARLALWAACLFRLFTPVAPTSALSFWGLFGRMWELPVSVPAAPSAPVAPTFSAAPSVSDAAATTFPASAPAAPAAPTALPASAVLTAVWIAVGAILAARYALAYVRTRRAVGRAIALGREDARYAALPKFARLREGPLDGAPLTFGVARPTVVLPPGLDGAELACVLAHEGVHARRRDNLWHYAAAAALTVFWWDPAVWLMVRLVRRDVELSCDRAAVRNLGADRRAEYANALVTLSTQAEGGAFCHGFGPRRTEERIISIMKYKKATITGIALTLALVLAVTVGFASVPGTTITDISSVTVTTGYRTPVAVQDCVLPESDSSELIRLINAYPRTVYPEGDTRTGNLLDVWVRLNCDDGGYYVLHYSYCSGFSWNPLHFGEDDYYSLLTRYDAAGNAGTTWKLDYDFDRPFIDWWTDIGKRIFSVLDDAAETDDRTGEEPQTGVDVFYEDPVNGTDRMTRLRYDNEKGVWFDPETGEEYAPNEEGYLDTAAVAGRNSGLVPCTREDCEVRNEHYHAFCIREDCLVQDEHYHDADGQVIYIAYVEPLYDEPDTEDDELCELPPACTVEGCTASGPHWHENGEVIHYYDTLPAYIGSQGQDGDGPVGCPPEVIDKDFYQNYPEAGYQDFEHHESGHHSDSHHSSGQH